MLHELTLKKDVRTFSVSPENPTGAKGAGALSLECAPSARLPAPLLEKAYAFYFQAAKSLATGDLNA